MFNLIIRVLSQIDLYFWSLYSRIVRWQLMRLDSKLLDSLFLVGPMGSGKTTIGKQLARELALKFIDSDHEVEIRAGADITWIFDVEGEVGFRERETKVLEELTLLPNIVLSTGGGSILRKKNRRYLKSRGVVVFLDTTVDIQMQRIENDKKRPLLQDVDKSEVLNEMKRSRDPLYNEVSDIKVFSGDLGSKRVVSNIIEGLVEKGFIEKEF